MPPEVCDVRRGGGITCAPAVLDYPIIQVGVFLCAVTDSEDSVIDAHGITLGLEVNTA